MTKRKASPNFATTARAVVTAFDHGEVYLIARALELQAVVIMELDRSYPDPDKRHDASLMRALAKTFYDVNQARSHIAKED